MRAFVVATALVGVLLAGCSVDPGHYVTVLDELKIPDDWVVLGTKIHGPAADADISCSPLTDSECPSVLRFYGTDGEPGALLEAGKGVVARAGYQIERELGGSCTPVSGSAYCFFEAVKGKERLQVAIYGNASTAGIPEAGSRGLVVVVTAKA